MKPIKTHPAFTHAKKFATAIPMVIALTCGAYANDAQSNDAQPNEAQSNDTQSEPKVPFDLEKFQPVLSGSRLHSPRTKNPIAVRAGRFGGYELPGRFYLGESGTTMVIGTTNSGRDRSELRHNATWSMMGEEKRYSARLRFDKPAALQGKSRLHLLQVYGQGEAKGPTVLVSWAGSWAADGDEDNLGVYVKGSQSYSLGPRPDGFFNLDVSIKEGVLRIYMNNELKIEDDLSKQSYANGNFFFKTGAYHRGIKPHKVEFEELTINLQGGTPDDADDEGEEE